VIEESGEFTERVVRFKAFLSHILNAVSSRLVQIFDSLQVIIKFFSKYCADISSYCCDDVTVHLKGWIDLERVICLHVIYDEARQTVI
jgi:hypothetical protein